MLQSSSYGPKNQTGDNEGKIFVQVLKGLKTKKKKISCSVDPVFIYLLLFVDKVIVFVVIVVQCSFIYTFFWGSSSCRLGVSAFGL